MFVDKGKRRRFVENCCVQASQAGVKEGMPIAEAGSLLDRPPLLPPADAKGDLLAPQELA